MRGWFLAVGLGFGAALLAGGARAEVKLSGSFVADAACPATQAIRTAENPGDVGTEAGRSYELLAGNKDEPTHYMIRVPGAEPERRWVKAGCGHVVGGDAAQAPAAPAKPSTAGGGKPEYVFALSWQPAFCETRPDKIECRTQTASRFDATHFTLHGLWPQPNGNFYCGVDGRDRGNDRPGRWRNLPPVKLEASTRAELDKVMPGTASQLERHEWIKHGTCYGKNAQDYFSDALRLVREVNASPVRALFEKNIGKELTSGEIRAAFDAAFGPGAGERVRVSCLDDRGRRMIGELTLGLVPPSALGFHIRDSIEIAGASRIGHGYEMTFERDAAGLMAAMAKNGVAVEINLTSNAISPGVKGAEHPLAMLRRAGVPFSLSADDEGVFRIDLTNEYVRAALEQGLTYTDLKTAGRNGIRYSFLPPAEKTATLATLEQAFDRFEARVIAGLVIN